MISNQIFAKSRDEFLHALSQAEKDRFQRCGSAQELLEEVRKMEVISKVKRKGDRLFGKINAFNDNLSPYFKIMEIFCNSAPEWTAIALGAFRLVL